MLSASYVERERNVAVPQFGAPAVASLAARSECIARPQKNDGGPCCPPSSQSQTLACLVPAPEDYLVPPPWLGVSNFFCVSVGAGPGTLDVPGTGFDGVVTTGGPIGAEPEPVPG